MMSLIGGANVPPLTASISPSTMTWSSLIEDAYYVAQTAGVNAYVTATPSGGSGAYTYDWEVVGAGDVSFGGTDGARFLISPSNSPLVVRCKVTDAVTGTEAYTDNCSVS